MTTMLERVADAIKKAQKVKAYGLYTYVAYPGAVSIVVDELRPLAKDNEVFRSTDRDAAEAVYEKLSKEYVARQVIEAMRDPTAAMSSSWQRDTPDWVDEVLADPDHPWRCMIDAALDEL